MKSIFPHSAIRKSTLMELISINSFSSNRGYIILAIQQLVDKNIYPLLTLQYASYLSKIGSPNSRCLFFSSRSFRMTFFRADGLFLAGVSRSLPRLTSGAVESNMLCGMWVPVA